MSYLTIEQLEARKDARQIAQYSNDENAAERVDVNVQAALDDASDYIDDRLADRFGVPLEAPDGAIRRICADLAVYYLAMRRRTEEPMDLAETRKKCDAAIDAWGRRGGTTPPFAGRDETKPFR